MVDPVRAGRVDELLGVLRAQGARITASRRAVVEALVHGPHHATAEDLAALVQRTRPDLHVSTVYRTLESLEQAGIAAHAHMGHGPAVWHLAEDERLHLVCERCGDVVHVPGDLFDGVRAELESRFGFRATLRHFAVPGRCRSCATLPG